LEMRCLRRRLGISHTDHTFIEEVRQTITQQVKHYEDPLTTVKKKKPRWYGHVTRSDGLFKTILQGTVQGKRRRGMPKKKWADNITEWTGKSSSTQALAHNRHKWSNVHHCQCPYDPGGTEQR